MIRSVVDNDVLHKTALFGLLVRLIATIPQNGVPCGILGAAKFVVGKKLSKARAEAALVEFNAALVHLVEVEPSEEELALAAHYEFEAQQRAVDLDTGESQLCAIVVTRALKYFLTGDKRAILALSHLVKSGVIDQESFEKKIVCLEQIIVWLSEKASLQTLRTAICAHSAIDKALAICFSCASIDAGAASVYEGLNSYIEDLRKKASVPILF